MTHPARMCGATKSAIMLITLMISDAMEGPADSLEELKSDIREILLDFGKWYDHEDVILFVHRLNKLGIFVEHNSVQDD